ncbi:MAG: hypothetical protein ACK559_01795, partial [bacterium]
MRGSLSRSGRNGHHRGVDLRGRVLLGDGGLHRGGVHHRGAGGSASCLGDHGLLLAEALLLRDQGVGDGHAEAAEDHLGQLALVDLGVLRQPVRHPAEDLGKGLRVAADRAERGQLQVAVEVAEVEVGDALPVVAVLDQRGPLIWGQEFQQAEDLRPLAVVGQLQEGIEITCLD